MNLNSFFQICVFFTIAMTVFTMSISFVTASGFFETGEVYAGMELGNNTSETYEEFTKSSEYPGGLSMGNLWLLVLTATGAIGLVVAWITHSTSIIGVFLFSFVFWASYGNALSITQINNYVPLGFLAIFTGGLVFIWIGAVIGMLSGSG